MQIRGMEGLSPEEINQQLEMGARFVVFEYTISLLVITFKNPTDVFFVRAGEGTFVQSLGYTLTTLMLGWWGIPWGPIYSFMALFTNLSGGRDVTAEVIAGLNEAYT